MLEDYVKKIAECETEILEKCGIVDQRIIAHVKGRDIMLPFPPLRSDKEKDSAFTEMSSLLSRLKIDWFILVTECYFTTKGNNQTTPEKTTALLVMGRQQDKCYGICRPFTNDGGRIVFGQEQIFKDEKGRFFDKRFSNVFGDGC